MKRCIGFDDGAFRKTDKRTALVGVVMRGNVVEAVLGSAIKVDGDDSTRVLLSTVRKAPQAPSYILIDGITLGGFNIVDLPALSKGAGKPVIAVTRKKPNDDAVRSAIDNVPNTAAKLRRLSRAGSLHRAGVCFHCAGIEPAEARRVLERNTFNGKMPECVRLAHLVAQGMTKGVSTGRA